MKVEQEIFNIKKRNILNIKYHLPSRFGGKNRLVRRIASAESWNMPDGICLWFHSSCYPSQILETSKDKSSAAQNTAKVKGTSQALSQFPHLMVQSGQSSYAATILVQEHTSEYDLECVEVQPTSVEKVSGYL